MPAMPDRSPRILVATTRTELRIGVCAALGDRGCAVIGERGDADVDALARHFAPDLVVLDLDGRRPPLAPVFWLPTASTTAAEISAAWRAGAVDVALDPADPVEVAHRIGAAVAAGSGLGDLTIDEAGHVARRAGAVVDLTATEFRLLVALATNVGIVVSKPQLLRAVWGFDDYHVNLVEVHVSALRRKLERHGERLIHTVRGVGYVMRTPSTRLASARPATGSGPDRPWTSPPRCDEMPTWTERWVRHGCGSSCSTTTRSCATASAR
jgi:two-component system, OmpR family, response regulator